MYNTDDQNTPLNKSTMSRWKLDNLETARRSDKLFWELAQYYPNVLSSVVPGSRLHSIIHNPITEGIDEG